MPEFGWQAQWDRGDSAAGRQPPDHRARLTEILAQVSRDVLQAEGLEDALPRNVDSLVGRLPVAIASIILLDDAGRRFVQEVWAGDLALEGVGDLPWDVAVGAAGRCARSGKAQLIADVHADPDYVPGNPAVRSEYLVPIRHRDRLHGVLNIESTDEDFFTPATCTVFDAVAHQIAGAIHLARVVAELEAANRKLQQLSTVDGLTGIANRRSFDERLVADCERLSREGGTLSLLLVEDDATVAQVVAGLLESQGHRVKHVAHGLAALAEIATQPFDAALLDLDLPGIDGLTLAQLMRQKGFARPMVAVTARADADAEAQTQQAGFDAFLRKPVTGALLAAALAAALAKETMANDG